MKTMLRPQLCASRCCLVLALAATAGPAFSADPPRTHRPGLFTRIGSVFQRIGRETESEMRDVTQAKPQRQQVETRYYGNGKSYQVLTSRVTVNTTTHWDGEVITPPPSPATQAVFTQPSRSETTTVVPHRSSGPSIIMRSSYSPGAGFSRSAPAPEPSTDSTPSPALDAFSPVPTSPSFSSSSPTASVNIEPTKQQVAASTSTVASTEGSNIQVAAHTEAPKVFPLGTFLSYGRVKSPYAPYNTLDVEGLPSGSFARDPSTGKIFRVP